MIGNKGYFSGHYFCTVVQSKNVFGHKGLFLPYYLEWLLGMSTRMLLWRLSDVIVEWQTARGCQIKKFSAKY